jgi:signal transduction histidine kinase
VPDALKFTLDVPQVRVSASAVGNRAVGHVVDRGIGLNPADAERVFQPFARLHGDERFDGTGLGLAVCRRIAERHGGRIWAEPARDGGTAVHVELPPAAPAVQAARRYSATIPS